MTNRRSSWAKRAVLSVLVAFAACAKPSSGTVTPAGVPDASTYEVYAIRYAQLPFRVSGLIAGADTSRRLDIAMMVWLLKGPNGRNVLVDAGFYREAFLNRWHPVDFVKPSEAVARFGVKPEEITDVIVSHVHWDHLDGADLFPKARVWIQREEFDHHLDGAGTVKDRAIDAADAKMLAQIS
ncbi:MAG TPA: MBL fold metallo-hydrolase, partial [Gemmatimonadaceae bacterium]